MNSANPPAETPPAQLPVSLLTRIFARHGGVNLLIAMGLLFVSAPIVQDLPNGDLIEALLVTLVMGAGVLAVGGRHRSLVAALGLVVPTETGRIP